MGKNIIIIMLIFLSISSCGKTDGNAVKIGSGVSPIPEVKADCNGSSCI